MPSAPVQSSSGAVPEVILAPGERFLVRRIAIDPSGDVAAQVELALESLSPFPFAQLYHGHVLDLEHRMALVFAAHRRNFTAEETAGWNDAVAVVPDFAAALRPAAKPAAGALLRQREGRAEVIMWDGTSAVPALVQVRAGESDAADALLAEARQRVGLGAAASTRRSSAAATLARAKGIVTIRLDDGAAESAFDLAALRAADVRDREVVAARDKRVRQDRVTWGVFAGVLAALAACVALEGLLVGLNRRLGSERADQAAQVPAIERIQAAHSLAGRLEQVSTERLMPFEMLATLNEKRPRTVEFTRVTTEGTWQLQIDAQTANVLDLNDYEAELRRLAPLERVTVRDQRTRDGLTTFRLEVSFKPGWARGGGT